MATQRALLLPEIVQCIVENTTNKDEPWRYPAPELFNYLTVSHMWYAEAIRVLWREIELRYLWNLPWERRQMFANYVVDLRIFSEYHSYNEAMSTDERMVGLMKNMNQILDFPKLDYVRLPRLSDSVPDEVIAQYFVPTLRSMQTQGGLSDGLLSTIASKCKRLDRVSIGFVKTGRSSVSGAETFVRNCNVRVLEIWECFDSLIDILATKEGLEELALHNNILSDMNLKRLTEQRQLHEHMFQSLTSLLWFSNTVAIKSIFSIMPMLKYVEGRVPDLNTALEHLTRWPLLERVSLYSDEYNLSLATVWAFVEKHRTLKELSLGFGFDYTFREADIVEELNDDWIRDVTSLLPLLHTLTIDIPSFITCQALIPIGVNCPFLHQFPVFKELLAIDPEEWVKDIPVLELEKHFPQCVMLPDWRRK